MGPMQVMIFGDIDFAYFILNGITMMYANDTTFIKAAFVLSMLFLLWSYIKWSMNPEKNTYPIREWAFGLIFFLIFGGTSISPKVDVQLHSATTPGLFKSTITDVPIIAAVPSWLATNLFYNITKVIHETGALIMPGYERLRGSGIIDKPDADPLTALVRLNTYTASSTLSPAMEKAIKDYIEQCYILEKSYNAADSKFGFTEKLVDEGIWDELKTTNIHFRVQSTDLTNSATIEESCIENHARIGSAITPNASGAISALALNKLSARGIHPDEIKYGYQIINQQLTGSAGSPNPYTIMVNMFLARSLKDTLNNSPAAVSMQTWAEKMVFEADRKRTFDSAGERSLFMKIYIPTITAIEAFSFYIAPILMIFSILGGYGFSFIGKYLMLIVFINLWSFIKAFVDIFTALALTKAFAPTNGNIEALKVHLSVMNFPQTLGEVESMLTMASNLTMAIPFFAMFLLYGGVHSVMGVMRTVTGGNVDGANMAPTMATTMNAGALQQGDTGSSLTVSTGQFAQTHQSGSNAMYGQNQTQAGLSSVVGASQASLKAEQDSSNQMWNQTLSTLKSDISNQLHNRQNGENISSTDGSSSQNVFSAINASANQYSHGFSSQAQVAAQLMASAGANVAFGGSGGNSSNSKLPEVKDPSGRVDQLSTAKNRLMSAGLSADLSASILNGLSESDLKALNQTFTDSQQKATTLASQKGFNKESAYQDLQGFTKQIADNKSWSDVNTISQQRTNLATKQQQLATTLDQNSGISSSNNLDFHRVAGFDIPKFTDFLNNNEGLRNRIAELWNVNSNANDIISEIMKNSGGDPSKVDGAFASFQMLKSLNKNDQKLETSGKDANLASTIYSELSNYAGVYSAGFKEAAQLSKEIGAASTTIQTAENNLPAVSVPNALGSGAKIEDSELQKITPQNNTSKEPIVAKAQNENLADKQGNTTQQDGSKNPIVPLMTGDEAKIIGQGLNPLNNVRTALAGGMSLAQALATNVGNFAELFQGRQALWGEQMETIAPNMASFAAKQLNIQSGELAAGLSSMGTMDHSAIPQLFKDLDSKDPTVANRAAQEISRLNDARMFASTKEGSSAIFDALDEKTGMHFVQSMKLFEDNLNKLGGDGLNSKTFNAISQSRMNGEITDNQAYTAISLMTGNTLHSINQNARYDDAPSKHLENDMKSLSWTLNNNDSTFKGSENASTIRSAIDKDNSASQTMNYYAPAKDSTDYRSEALKDFTLDSTQYASLAGRMQEDNTFAVGYNSKPEEDNRNKAPYKYISGVLSQGGDFEQVNKDLVQNSINPGLVSGLFTSKDDLKDRQEQIFTIVASPIPHNERLENAGFVPEAAILNTAVSDLTQKAQEQYIAIPEAKMNNDFLTTKEISNQLPSASELLKTN